MRAIRLIVVAILVTVSVSSAGADVIQGTGILSVGSWDFSEQVSVDRFTNPNSDLSFAFVVDPPLGYRVACENGAVAVLIQDSTFDEVTVAPEDTTLYSWDLPAQVGATYVIRTTERHYAKFTPLQLEPVPIIRYAYQPDGSRALIDPVPIEETTWGRVKALYQ